MSEACDRWAEIADRRLVGDEIDEDDERFAEEHARECPLCRAEADVYGQLAEPADSDTAAIVERVLAQTKAPPISLADERQRRVVFAGAMAAALALAATFALWMRAPAEAPAPSAPHAELASVTGSVLVDGRPASAGLRLAKGARIETENGRACVSWNQKTRACFDRQSRATLVENDPARRQIELLRGSVVAALDPLPAGQTFVITSGAANVRVKGTVFSVTRSPTGSDVVVRVHQGVVAANSKDVTRGEQLALATGTVSIVPADVRTKELALVGVALPEPKPEPAPPPPEAADAAPEETPPAAAADAGPSAADLLREAQGLRASGNAAGAAAAYRKLQALHPRSAEASASRLSLAELMLGPLGDPSGALAAYDAYLRSGGGLQQEARYGKIMALRRLGRAGEERAAIEAFVRDYPNSVQARALSARLPDAAP